MFVFLLNPASLESTACKRECGYAAELGKPVLPILVSGEVSTNLLPPALSEIQFVDYREPDRDAAFRLARAMGAVPPPDPLPDPLPVPPEVPISYLGSLTEIVESASALSYEEQSALVVDLKRGLRDPATAGDARELFAKLRARRDLFAAIADEIDEAMGKSGAPSGETESESEGEPAVRSSAPSGGIGGSTSREATSPSSAAASDPVEPGPPSPPRPPAPSSLRPGTAQPGERSGEQDRASTVGRGGRSLRPQPLGHSRWVARDGDRSAPLSNSVGPFGSLWIGASLISGLAGTWAGWQRRN